MSEPLTICARKIEAAWLPGCPIFYYVTFGEAEIYYRAEPDASLPGVNEIRETFATFFLQKAKAVKRAEFVFETEEA